MFYSIITVVSYKVNKVGRPGKGPFHLPAVVVTRQVGFPAEYRPLASAFWNIRLNPSLPQAPLQVDRVSAPAYKYLSH
jgi:hypothetical protein